MIGKSWRGPWPPRDEDHPLWGMKGHQVRYCCYPFDWSEQDRVQEAIVLGAWFDNDYPCCNVRLSDGRIERGVIIDRFRVISLVERIAELDRAEEKEDRR